MCGSDWRNYETIYNSYPNDFWWQFKYMEPSFVLTMALGNIIGLNFWSFFIILKLITSIIIYRFIQRYCSEEYFFFAIAFFTVLLGYFMFIDNPMRNVIAVAIFLYAIPCIEKNNFKKYLLITLLAATFHFSAIVLIPLYFILKKNYSNKSLVIIFIITNLIFIDRELLLNIAEKLFSFIPIINQRIRLYSEANHYLGKGKIFSFMLFFHTLMFFLLLISRKKFDSYKHGVLIFNMSILFPIVFRIGLTILALSRYQMYFVIYYAIAILIVADKFTLLSKYIYYILVFSLCLSIGYKNVTSNTKYIPYTNYFMWFYKDLTFQQRSNYNPINSPYK